MSLIFNEYYSLECYEKNGLASAASSSSPVLVICYDVDDPTINSHPMDGQFQAL